MNVLHSTLSILHDPYVMFLVAVSNKNFVDFGNLLDIVQVEK